MEQEVESLVPVSNQMGTFIMFIDRVGEMEEIAKKTR